MIVTCPGCASKYRVRDEAVPPGGAEFKCPSCGAVFVAHPPKHSEEEIGAAVERLTKAKDAAEARVAELDAEKKEIERRAMDAERRAGEAEARLQQLEAQIIVLKSELAGAASDLRAQMQPLEAEIQRLREDNARAVARANANADAEARVLSLTEELARARAAANHAPEIQRLTEELQNATKTTGRLYTELEVEKTTVARLEAENNFLKARGTGDSGRADQLTAEVQRLKDEIARLQASSSSAGGAPPSSSVTSLVAAVGPLLWGLEQAVKYLEPFAASEPTLATHVRQLQILQAVLKKLNDDAAT
jgi:predicted Zn finger-like uncharacterized protein